MPREDPHRPPASSRISKKTWRPHAIDALLLASLVIPALVFGGVATHDRSQTLAAAERDLLATLDTLQGHAGNVFQFQALALGATNERLRDRSDEEVLASVASHHAYLRALRRHAGEMLGIVAFGTDGRPLVESDRPVPSRSIDISDRDYFRWHRDHPGSEPYVAGPIRSRTDGKPIFFVTLRRSSEDGSFLGVVAAGVRQSTFTDYWNRATLDQDALVSLIREDGIILARRPVVDPDRMTQLPPATSLLQAARSGGERVVLQGRSPIDGIERLSAVRRLDHFPVYIAYGVPKAAALAPWYHRLPVYGGFAAAVAGALFSLALLARRRTRELHDMNASLEQRVAERTAEIHAGEARLRLLAREVDHRSKNALAVVQATLRLTPKSDPATYAEAVEGRVSALARVQTLLSEDRWRGARLRALLQAELAPFVSRDRETGPWAELEGPPALLPPAIAQPLAMVVHELATNAVKHGALSVPGGRVKISWRVIGKADAPGSSLTLRWAETGGPALTGPPAKRGFGSRVLRSVVRGQIGGTLSLFWVASGLVCEIETPLSPQPRMARPDADSGAA